MTQNEFDIDGAIETDDGVEFDIGGVVERDTEAGAPEGLSIPGFFGGTLSPVLPLFKENNL